MRDRTIKIEPFDFVDLLACDITKSLNHHATVKIKGHISNANKDKYLEMATDETTASVICIDESGQETMLFRGMVKDMEIRHQNAVNILEANLVSDSYRMDHIEQIRVFQNANATYHDVLAYLGEAGEGNPAYQDYSFILHVPEAEQIGGLIVQYHETDWQFAQRLASRFQSYLVPEYLVGGVKYYFGPPHLATGSLSDLLDYRSYKALDEYAKKIKHGLHLSESDMLAYVVKHRDIFELTQPVEFQNRALMVYQIESHLDGKELIHTYTLRPESSFRKIPYDNEKITGVSLAGKVINVRKDEVQILLPQKGLQSPALWFPFATVYSSPDGTGWYCMPEIDDEIRLHFPNEKESASYVINAMHLPVSDTLHRSNPDYKSLKNKYGKEVLFTPEALILTNNNGMSVEIVDDQGITIRSDKNLTLAAGQGLSLASYSSNINVIAKEAVHVQQNGTAMTMSDSLNFQAPHVYVSGGNSPLITAGAAFTAIGTGDLKSKYTGQDGIPVKVLINGRIETCYVLDDNRTVRLDGTDVPVGSIVFAGGDAYLKYDTDEPGRKLDRYNVIHNGEIIVAYSHQSALYIMETGTALPMNTVVIKDLKF